MAEKSKRDVVVRPSGFGDMPIPYCQLLSVPTHEDTLPSSRNQSSSLSPILTPKVMSIKGFHLDPEFYGLS